MRYLPADPHPTSRGDCPSGIRPRTLVKLVFGLALVAVGVAWLLTNLGLVSLGDYLCYWPALLIVVGVGSLLRQPRRSGFFWGLLATTAGTLLLAHNVGILVSDPAELWPAVLVVLGASLVLRPRPTAF